MIKIYSRFLSAIALGVLMFLSVGGQAQTSSFTLPIGNICTGSAVTFTNTSTGATQYNWTITGPNGFNQNANVTNLILIFPACGNYNVSLTSSVGGSNPVTSSQPVTVYCLPVASFTPVPPNGCNPLSVTFNSTSTAGSGSITNYQWDVGNGQSSTNTPSVSTTYNTTGAFNVQLIVTNSFGCQADTIVNGSVHVGTTPTGCFTSANNITCGFPSTVNFSWTPSGGTPPYTYAWTFSPSGGNNPSILTSTSATPAVTYNAQGTYTVSLTVTDAYGCTTTCTQNNFVIIGNATYSITGITTPICAGGCITPSGNAIPAATSYTWSTAPAGGVTISNGTTANPTICFANAGNYTITSTATFAGGCVRTQTASVVVQASAIANASVTIPNGCSQPYIANIVNTSSPGMNYQWNFPGGSPASSTLFNPGTITYNLPGTNPIVLVVTNPATGCQASWSGTANFGTPTSCFSDSMGTNACWPAPMYFNAGCSVGTNLSYQWNFGDASSPQNTSTLATPQHIFTAPGCYNITLTVIQNPGNCQDVYMDSVCIGGPIVPCFTATPLDTCASVVVHFTNCSTIPAWAPVGQPTWCIDFVTDSVGSPPYQCMSTLANPTYAFQDTGCHNIAFMSNFLGCVDTLLMTHMVCTQGPITIASVKYVCNSLCAYLNAGNSIAADSFAWTIPGGATAVTYGGEANGVIDPLWTSANPLVNSPGFVPDNDSMYVCWPVAGSYQVNVSTFNDTTPCVNTKNLAITVGIVSASLNPTTPICAPGNMSILNNSVFGTNFTWNIFNTCPGSPSTPIATYTGAWPVGGAANPAMIPFNAPGFYDIQLIVSDVHNCKDTTVVSVVANGLTPQFTAAPTQGCPPLLSCFSDLTTPSCTSNPLSYSWDFGDGTTSAQHNPCHTFLNGGVYDITLSVTDDDGCTSTVINPGMIDASAPNVSFLAQDTSLCTGSSALFINTSTGITSNTVFYWNYGDGGPNFYLPMDSTGVLTSNYTYNTSGIYTVTMWAVDTVLGCMDTTQITQYMAIDAPIASFTADSVYSSCPPLPVNFTNTSYCPNACTYAWNFGDGSPISTFQNPFHIYNYPGVYTVTLTVTDANGCTSISSMPAFIQVDGPVASVSASIDSGCVALPVNFTANSNAIVTYNWLFGDNTPLMAGGNNISHTYQYAGVYYPQVLISDGICSYFFVIDTIVVDSISGLISATPTDLCGGGIVQFADSSSAFTPLVSWSWDFGDPLSGANNTSNLQNPTHDFQNGQGTYVVTLTVTSSAGCTTTTTFNINVTPAPTAAFTYSPNPICPNTTITLTDNSISQSPAVAWTWTFTDPSAVVTTSNLQNPTYNVGVSGNYNVQLLVTSLNGCVDSILQTLSVVAPANANAGVDTSVCLNDSIQLNGSGGVTYVWAPGVINSVANPFVNPIVTTTYTLTIVDANGCVGTDQVQVTVHTLPTVNAGADQTVCLGQNATLNGAGALTYQWTANPGGSVVNGNPVSVSPPDTTTYQMIGYDINGCRDTDYVDVNILPLPVVDALPDTAVCAGNSVTLTATGAITYTWAPGGAIGNSILVSPAVTTTYTVNGVDANSCANTATATVIVNALPPINAGLDQINCFGSPATLNASGGVSYNWFDIGGNNIGSTSSVTINPLDTADYFVIGVDGNGCVNADTMTVIVLFPFTITCPGNSAICALDSIALIVTGANPNYNITWTPPTGLSNPNTLSPMASPAINTTYTIQVTDGSCFSDNCSVTVTVNPNPVISAGPDLTLLDGSPTNITTTTTIGGGTWMWNPPTGLDCPTCQNPVATTTTTTTYTLTYTDPNGCKAIDSMIVYVFCNDNALAVPNAFTPDGDGVDDVFNLKSNGLQSINFLRIYDRWGEKVFETTDVNQGWDGTKNGVALMPDAYVYWIEAVCSNGYVVSVHGNVTLIR